VAACASSHSSAAPQAPATSSPAPAPTTTQTVTAGPTAPNGVPAKTSWSVVSEYYGDIESGDFRNAYALLSSGSVTGQSYQQFVQGFKCSSFQDLTDLGTTGDTVQISLQAVDSCNGGTQQFQGTYTVQNGLITAADIKNVG
jgi:hypothetical protein